MKLKRLIGILIGKIPMDAVTYEDCREISNINLILSCTVLLISILTVILSCIG